jgi:hypothetical protein
MPSNSVAHYQADLASTDLPPHVHLPLGRRAFAPPQRCLPHCSPGCKPEPCRRHEIAWGEDWTRRPVSDTLMLWFSKMPWNCVADSPSRDCLGSSTSSPFATRWAKDPLPSNTPPRCSPRFNVSRAWPGPYALTTLLVGFSRQWCAFSELTDPLISRHPWPDLSSDEDGHDINRRM